ncbi:hypothetical protein BGX21_001519 [Mortierella sp. AD011]|nr:hypothetical protein BGX20_001427 [Mortierella sp. AD010]KAF9383638.1 hypothetical protein BGX21_001519 [Mortierella sp. AD011]
MSRHSKNNTARGHFTYAEKQMLEYGTKKQRLGRDSMRDFDACFLCLQTARDPVCCPEGHLSCKECMYENILAQKQEIERQAKLCALQQEQEQQEQTLKEELAQQIILKEFEKSQMGVLSKTKSVLGKLTADTLLPESLSTSNETPQGQKKRPFELDTAELERMSKQERIDVAKAIEEEAKSKKPVLPSFWVPSLTPSDKKSELKPTKLNTVCTATDKEHKLSLKHLIPVKFETAMEDHDESEAKYAKVSSICPFVKKEGKCQTCDRKTKEKDIIVMRGEGSGFSAGGAKEAKKFDVAFQ